jgi:hypothetical protein
MTEEKAQEYANCIVNGELPKQRIFTFEETRLLVKTALVWAAEQIDHEAMEKDPTGEDVNELLASFKNVKEAYEDVHNYYQDGLDALADFIEKHLD